MKKILFIFGTRPEAIKCVPVIKEFQKYDHEFQTIVCNTGQHREMLDDLLLFFRLECKYDLGVMRPDQSLSRLSQRLLKGLEVIFEREKPDFVFVQGDTTTAFIGALAAYYHRVPVAHIEAGLRSGDIYSPFPEEANRKFISDIAAFNFTPTKAAGKNVNKPFYVGNTVIDTLLLARNLIEQDWSTYKRQFSFLNPDKKLLLVTTHRRENFGPKLLSICDGINQVADLDVEIIYSIHPNPNVKNVVKEQLKGRPNIHLLDFINYPSFVWLMNQSYLILSDSGGVQEEAPSFKKPVLVLRDTTERMESVEAGYSRLIGCRKVDIYSNVINLLKKDVYNEVTRKMKNPYGDGHAAARIVRYFLNRRYAERF